MKSLLFTGLAAAAAISTSASAGIGDTRWLSPDGYAGFRDIRFNYNGSLASNDVNTGHQYFGIAGANKFQIVTGDPSHTPTGREIIAFCVEMNEGFVNDPIEYTITEISNVPEENPPGNMDATRQTLMQDLFRRHYGDVIERGAGESQDEFKNEAAAFQLAIWEISHENFMGADASAALMELDLSLGAMTIFDTYSQDVADIANAMFASLGVNGWKTMGDNLLGLTNPDNQDLLFVVPSPAIAGLAGLGLVGMRRRRR